MSKKHKKGTQPKAEDFAVTMKITTVKVPHVTFTSTVDRDDRDGFEPTAGLVKVKWEPGIMTQPYILRMSPDEREQLFDRIMSATLDTIDVVVNELNS